MKIFNILLCCFAIFMTFSVEIFANTKKEDLYKDYEKGRDDNISLNQFSLRFGGHFMNASGIDREAFAIEDKQSEIGSSMFYHYTLYKPTQKMDMGVHLGWYFVRPNDYMTLWSLGTDMTYHLDARKALKASFSYVKQGGTGSDLADGTMFGLGYEYKFNKHYTLFMEYQRASFIGQYRDKDFLGYYDNYNLDYNINIFSLGLVMTLGIFDTMPQIENDGMIEKLGISFGFGTQNSLLEIEGKSEKFSYENTDVIVPMSLESIDTFFANSKKLGYQWFSMGYEKFNYQRNISSHVNLSIAKELEGSHFYFAPSLFYTNKDYEKMSLYYKLSIKAGLGILNLDIEDDTSYRLQNKIGLYTESIAEIGIGNFAISAGYVYASYAQGDNDYTIDGWRYLARYTVKFKDIFSQDW